MNKNKTINDILLSKLRQPIHVSYICEHILKTNVDVCKEKITKLEKDGLIKMSEYGKDYYVKV